MGRSYPQLVTVNEAVGLLVNMHTYSDEEDALYEILEDFKEEAEVEYENAEKGGAADLVKFEFRKLACESRYHLAIHLEECLKYEVSDPEGSELIISEDQKIDVDSLSLWAGDRFGIDMVKMVAVKKRPETWDQVKIEIWDDYIRYSINKVHYKREHFREIGLMGAKRKKMNETGEHLVSLCLGKILFADATLGGAYRGKIRRLRKMLCDWVKIADDPFLPRNQYEGLKPRFKIKYHAERADEFFEKRRNVPLEKMKERWDHTNKDDDMNDPRVQLEKRNV